MASQNIHPTAIVHPAAKLGEDVTIGAYSIVEDDVEIGDGTEIQYHVVIASGSRLGKNVKVFNSASVGGVPQDLKFAGEKTYAFVGDGTVLREYVTVNRGTHATGKTVVGKNCLLMACSHIGHDCVVGDNVIMANGVLLGGHVEIGDDVTIGGEGAVHQFCRVGIHAMVAADCMVVQDVGPYILTSRHPLRYSGLNVRGLRRKGFSNEEIRNIHNAYRIIYQEGRIVKDAIEKVKVEIPQTDGVKNIIAFFSAESKRGFIKGVLSAKE
jgi:UDP-N-acetylglucosamine acyltransferase